MNNLTQPEMERIRQSRGLPEVPPLRQTTSDEPLDLSSGRFLNETAIRDHALRCSARFRNNKFTRVGQDFIDEIKTDVEKLVRDLRRQWSTQLFPPLEPDEKTCCVTGSLSDKVSTEFNRLICRMIQEKVRRQPSCGKTLSRTR